MSVIRTVVGTLHVQWISPWMGNDDSNPLHDSSSARTAELEHASVRLKIASHVCCSNTFWLLAVVLTHRDGSLRGSLSTLPCTAAVYDALCLLHTMLHCTELQARLAKYTLHCAALRCIALLKCTAFNCTALYCSTARCYTGLQLFACRQGMRSLRLSWGGW